MLEFTGCLHSYGVYHSPLPIWLPALSVPDYETVTFLSIGYSKFEICEFPSPDSFHSLFYFS